MINNNIADENHGDNRDSIRQNDSAGVENKDYQSDAISTTPTNTINGIIYRYVLQCNDPDNNGKCYVGETPNENKRRKSWKRPNGGNYAGKKLKEARAKWSIEHWKYEVLERFTVNSTEEYRTKSEELETKWIKHFNSYENGFNSNRGGKGNKGVKFDEERCKQNGDNRRGKPQPRESVERGLAKRKGYHHSEETCAAIGKGNKGKKRTDEQRAAQSQRMKGVEPKAATAGAKEWHKKHPGGYWGEHTITDEMRANMKEAQQKKGKKIKATLKDGAVICFPTMLDAAKHFDMGVGSISHFLQTGNLSEKANAHFEKITSEEYEQWKRDNADNQEKN